MELLIKNAAQILTMAGPARPRRGGEMDRLEIVDSGSVLIEDDRIVGVGRSLVPRRSNSRVLDLNFKSIVAPAFVDSHTHSIFAGTRHHEYEMRARGASYQDIAAAGGGIWSTVQGVRAASEDELAALAAPRMKRFLSFGTTTVEIKSGYGLSMADELKMLRVARTLAGQFPLSIVPTFLGAHAYPPEFRDRHDLYLDALDQTLDAIACEELAEFVDAFCEHGYFSVEETRRHLSAARQRGFRLKVHAEELSVLGGARLAAELGATSADHLEFVGAEAMDAMAEASVIATLLPATAFSLGLETLPPARRLIEHGVPVALASDFNPGTSHNQNMQLVLTMACSQLKMTPAEALTAATINGAYAVNRPEVGSLEPGKQADLVIFGVTDYREIPYHFGVNHVERVLHKGKIVYRGG